METPSYKTFIYSLTSVKEELRALEKVIDCRKTDLIAENLPNNALTQKRITLKPEYDDSTVRPASTLITNKVRLDVNPVLIESNGKTVNAVPARYINDCTKLAKDRFRYFSIPPEDGTQNTIESFELDVDRKLLAEYGAQAESIYNSFNAANERIQYKNCIPPEVYTHNWKVYNRDFIANRGYNTGVIGTKNTGVDVRLLNVLRQLYPTYNDQMLRKDYDYLVAINGLSTSSSTSIKVTSKTDSSVAQKLLGIIQDCTTISSLNTAIERTIKDIPDTLVFSRFTIINPSNMRRNMFAYKLAFMCGSTNETIVKDISDIGTIIANKVRSF